MTIRTDHVDPILRHNDTQDTLHHDTPVNFCREIPRWGLFFFRLHRGGSANCSNQMCRTYQREGRLGQGAMSPITQSIPIFSSRSYQSSHANVRRDIFNKRKAKEDERKFLVRAPRCWPKLLARMLAFYLSSVTVSV